MNFPLSSLFRQLFSGLFLLMLLQLLGSQQAHATHAMGADLTYACLGGDTYEFTLTFYRDCAPGAAPASASYPVTISSASCGQLAIIVLNQVGTAIDISPLCPADKPNSTCNGGTLPGVEQYTYTGTYTFPQNCSDWIIQWENCCRNGAITNSVVNTLTTETVIQAQLDNLSVSCNSSPTFTTIPIPYVCAGQSYFFNHGAYDPDGDSLAFELTDPLEKNGAAVVPVPYVAGFTPAYPISTTPANSFNFDPLTGQMNFVPGAIQNGIVTLLVKQYRNGVLIGTTMRDIQLVVLNCNNTSPVVGPPTNISGGSLNGNTFSVCAGNTLSFNFTASDIDPGDQLTAGSTITTTIPGATITLTGTNPVTGTVTWATSLANVGMRNFTLTVADDACPIPSSQVIGFAIAVHDQVEILTTDTLVCPGTAQSVPLQAYVNGGSGNGTFTWTPATGLSNPNIANPIATVNGPATYTVSYTEGTCTSTDAINLISEGSLAVTPAAPVVCNGATVQLNAAYTATGNFSSGGCALSTATCSGPSSTDQVGSGTNVSGTTGSTGGQGSPYAGLYTDARTQVLFRAAELTASGVNAGLISSLALQVATKSSTAPYTGFTIKIGCTRLNSLTGFEPGLSTVFSGNVTTTPGWNTHIFTNGYEWDGVSNLIVEFCYDNLLSSGLDQVLVANTSYNSVAFQRANFTVGCNLASPVFSTQRPQMRFTSCAVEVPIAYSWTPAAGLSNANIANPVASPTTTSTYTVTVSTPSCTFTDNVPITVQQPPTLNALPNQALCAGGSVNLSATGTNLAGATYSWFPATGLSNPNIANPVANPTATTTYTLTASNSCGSDVQTVTITVNAAPAVNLAVTPISCNNANNGAITATASGGGGGYVYAWTPSAGAGPTVSNLPAGAYSLTVTDANTCTATATTTLGNPVPVVASVAAQTNVDCFGANTGSFTAAGSGGTAGYTYSINGTAFQVSPVFNGLTAGSYTLTVRDANNCTGTLVVPISQPAAALSATLIAQTNADCNVPNGSLTAGSAGGTAPYQYSLDGVNFQASGTFNTLPPGIYLVTIRDANLCTTTLNVNITAPTAPVGTIAAQTNITCNGNTNGAVTVTATGGNPGYDFSIDGVNFGASGTFTNLAAGLYIVSIRDAIGCLTQMAVNITEPAPLTGLITAQTDVDCNGNSTGSVTLVGSGGTPAYQYSIDGVNFFVSGTFTGLTAGNYTVIIRDQNLCTGSVPVTLTEPTPLAATPTLTQVDCNGASTGAISLAASGGSPNYAYSLNGLVFNPLNTFTGLAAGNYTVYVRDNNGCVNSQSVVLTQPAALSASISSQSNVDCNGAANGAVTVAASGGAGNYQYSIDGVTYLLTGSFTGLTAGMYTVTVRDANGCTEPVQVNLTEPTVLTLVPSALMNVSCNGLADGSIVAVSTGGIPPYQFSIDGVNFVSTTQFQNLAAGSYTLSVRDANNCIQTAPFTLGQPAAVTGSVSSQVNVDCNGAATGSVSVLATGGIGAGYQYTIDGINFSPVSTFSNLIAGSYTITLMDGNGCTGTLPVTITEPAALSAALQSQIQVDCNGAASGSFSAIGVGGTAPYAYQLNTGGFVNSGAFGSLTAGTYTLTVRDANGCLASLPVIVTEPAALTASLSVVAPISCGGQADGVLEAVVTGGTAPYTYAWTPGNASTSQLAGLATGSYSLTVTDDRGCTATASFTLTEPAPVIALATGTDALCNGTATGTASANVSGGTAPYSYLWNNTPALNTATLSNLAANTYTVIATDANGCADTAAIVVGEPAPIVLATSFTNETCTDANGTATVVASGGAGSFLYEWDSSPLQNTATATGLPAGSYTITVTDLNGCQESATVSLQDEAAPVLALQTQTNVSCSGLSNGSATVLATGGTGSYAYSWNTSPVISAATATGLPAASYLVVVDDGQCTDSLSVVITQPDPLAATISNFAIPSCFGASDGTATVTVSGGTAPFTYTWNTPNPVGGPAATGLPSGTYGVNVVDANGCQASAQVTLVDPPQLTLSLDATHVRCFGGTDGSIEALAVGGVPPYSYNWSNGATIATASGLSQGSFWVIVTDANGCAVTASTEISQPALLEVTTSHTDLRCFESGDGTATAIATGGTPGYSYLWSNNSNTPVTGTLSAGPYSVQVSDLNDCTAQGEVLVGQPDSIRIDLVDQNIAYCNLANGSLLVDAVGGIPDYVYNWNTQPAQSGPMSTELAGGSFGGPYTVTATDANGCENTLSLSLDNLAPPVAAFVTDPELDQELALSKAAIDFTNTSTGAVTYLWDFGDGSPFTNVENPGHTYAEPGTYTILLTAIDPNNSCPDTTSLSFTIIPDGVLFFPNAFSPNGDGHNDAFFVAGEGIVEMELVIFDRWGVELKRLYSETDSWDGTNANGNEVQEGVYVYVIKAILNNGAKLERGGSITLIR